jgi:hypothetical protein
MERSGINQDRLLVQSVGFGNRLDLKSEGEKGLRDGSRSLGSTGCHSLWSGRGGETHRGIRWQDSDFWGYCLSLRYEEDTSA